ncbi:DUF2213 domain-containing protein [Avibacterium paragallinarum]|uniref:DUF2213 domain-containing protein n=1 Tax=Avibacterium paragallinarum TaxID=728 RepID=UPI003977F8AE
MRFNDKAQTARTFTKDGYLVVPATLSKVGIFDYLDSELNVGNQKAVKKVARTEGSLFGNETIKSFEGVPITVGHPKENVNAKNWKALSVGVVRNVVRDQDTLKGEAWIYDEETIRLIQDHGIQELSCGYDCKLTQTQVNGADYEMSPMIGNHVAIVARGRCGGTVKLADEENAMSKKVKLLDSILGVFGISLSDEQKKQIEEEDDEQTSEMPKKKSGENQPEKPAEQSAKKEKNAASDEEKEKEKRNVKDEALVKENAELKAKIQKLEDEAKASVTAQKRSAVLADAKMISADLSFADSDTVRQIQEKVIIHSGIAPAETLTALSDEAIEGMYQAAKNISKKLQDHQLGSAFLNDSKPQSVGIDFNKLYGGQQ